VTVESRHAVIGKDDFLKGHIRNGRRIDVYGYVEGSIESEVLVIHEGGQVYGTARAGDAEVRGVLQGEGIIKNLIDIAATGSVIGSMRYGRIAMAPGANLSAEVRNIPPELAGDFQVLVNRGRTVVVTTADLTAFDPDDTAAALVFHVTNATNGRIKLSGPGGGVVTQFTQADLMEGRVLFEHDGSKSATARFDVVVTDHSGASSGPARTVNVSVRAAA
jgi:cytoskeletal protein CcmA (bactofilin family)